MLVKIAFTGFIAGLALAVSEPQTPEQTTAAIMAYKSYIAALRTEPALTSLACNLRTDAAGRQSFLSVVRSLYAEAATGATAGTTAIEAFLANWAPVQKSAAFPTNVQSVLVSAYSRINAIGTENGFSFGEDFPTATMAPTAQPTPAPGTVNAGPAGRVVRLGGVLMGAAAAVAAVL